MADASQASWPYGPAPTRDCPKSDAHDWLLIDLYRAAEPPAPSFVCSRCGWKWSRGWTKEEFRRVILYKASADTLAYYGDGSNYPDEPEYAK